MTITHKLVDIEKKEALIKKVNHLCKVHKCSAVDLLIMSMETQRAIKIKNNK